MADAVATRVLVNGPRTYTALFLNQSDGTGEAAVVKVDRSALADLKGNEPGPLRIVKAKWSIQGFPYVKVAFDHTADDTVLLLGAGVGELCLEGYSGVKDPNSDGGTGDIVFTAPAGANTGTYCIVLEIEK